MTGPFSSLTWTVSGGGTISSSGLFTAGAGEGGPFTITANGTLNGASKSGTAQILVINQSAGLNCRYYEGTFSALPNFGMLVPKTQGIAENFTIDLAQRTTNMGLQFSGQLYVPTAGQYTLFLNVDDEASLKVDGSEAVHAIWSQGERSAAKTLTAGMHQISLDFYQGSGGVNLSVSWLPPNGVKQDIPAAFFFQSANTAIVAPVSRMQSQVRTIPSVTLYSLRGERIGKPADIKGKATHLSRSGIVVANSSDE